jgi:hypothetical protein
MKLNRKLEIAETAITSISRHEDEDGAVRVAALDRVIAFAEAEKKGIADGIAADIAAKLAPEAPPAAE